MYNVAFVSEKSRWIHVCIYQQWAVQRKTLVYGLYLVVRGCGLVSVDFTHIHHSCFTATGQAYASEATLKNIGTLIIWISDGMMT